MNGFRQHSFYNPAGIEYRNNVITMSTRDAANAAQESTTISRAALSGIVMQGFRRKPLKRGRRLIAEND